MGKAMVQESKYDEIGYWSEVKLDIIREYAAAYSRILSSQESPSFIIFMLMHLREQGFTYLKEQASFFQVARLML